MTDEHARYSNGLLRLIAANEPYWGAEAEVVRSYWDSPVRTTATDRKWVVHQIYKEYWDGILPPLDLFRRSLPLAGERHGRDNLLTIAGVICEEVEHFVLFADLYRDLVGTDYALTPGLLKVEGAWPENDELMQLRQRHKNAEPELGLRAHRFTEGGYCAIFTEGMALAGRGGKEETIARVCRRIYDDEFHHMLLGIIESDNDQLSDADWDTLVRYTVEQMKLRIHMRNAQFSYPVQGERLEELMAGQAAPLSFDFDAAARLLADRSGAGAALAEPAAQA